MNFKQLFFSLIASGVATFGSLHAQVLMPSKDVAASRISLNGNWKFKYFPSHSVGSDSVFFNPNFDVANWKNIKTPGNWELQGFSEPVYGKKFKEAAGLYRTTFTVPQTWNKNPVYIAFDGVQSGYSVWVNGKNAGSFSSSFNRQTFDISQYVKPGQSNTLAVKVITHPKGWEFDTNDDWSLSGIFRDVTLFTLSPVHIKDVVIKTFVPNNQNASLNIHAIVERSGKEKFSKNLQLSGKLKDASGAVVKEFTIPVSSNSLDKNSKEYNQSIQIERPKLWSAETPYLYSLSLTLVDGAKQLQSYTERVGIREVTWANGILKINNQPIKLKGVNHHDLSPVNGRAITEAELKEDLRLMQEANVNFIRLCHYPPQPRLLELADSLGIYLMDEVPFGYGDELLKDESYLPILKQRAQATIWRDKNHPSVIIWSVGNENPVTDIGLKTGRYVKSLDNTRPYCFPQTPSVIMGMMKAMPDSVDVLDFHYPSVKELDSLAKVVDRPLVASEYAHALGIDFGTFDKSNDIMYDNPKLAGGAIWGFMDQGIVRKADKQVAKEDATIYAWPDKDHIYDTGDIQGTDGITYANRVPQTDYWNLRKVYSPIRALDGTLYYKPGQQMLQVKLQNRHDFTDLSEVKGRWILFADNAEIDSGSLTLKGQPREVVTVAINTKLPEKPLANFYYLKLVFQNKQGYQFYEKSYPVQLTGNNSSILSKIGGSPKQKTTFRDNVVENSRYRFELSKAGVVQVKNSNGEVLISEGLFARVGRKPTIAQDATTSSKRSAARHKISKEFLLSNPETKITAFNAKQLAMDYKFSPNGGKDGIVNASVNCLFSDSGYVQVNYILQPQSKVEAVETGLSFIIPKSYTEFRWVGNGPYAAYPGKDKLSEFGIYHLSSNDIYFPGNRKNVQCAMFSDAKGNGFALIAKDANIAVERTDKGIVVSHNANVSGTFNKYEWPEDLYSFATSKGILGNFVIVPFTSATYSSVLKDVFGDSTKRVNGFQPFYNSYDQ